LKIKKTNLEISSNEPAYSYPSGNIKIIASSKDWESSFNINNRFILNDLPPRSTLRIQGRFEQKKHFYPLISTLKKMEIKNINIIIDLNPSNKKCVYLFEIDLFFDNDICLWTYPLKNYQPNSDLFLVAKEFLPSKINFNLIDLFFTNFPSNHLEISLKNSHEDLKTFLKFMRAISFIRSHPYGIYFYIPLKNSYIEAISFLPITLSIMIYYIFDWFCLFYSVSIIRIFIGTSLYFFCPLFSLFFLRRNEIQCFILIFMIFNFKFGIIYMSLCYLRMIHDIFRIILLIFNLSKIFKMKK